MALHDKHVHRWFATGIAGLSVVADSCPPSSTPKVHPVRDENGIIVDFEIEGEFPKYGNDDDRVDVIAHDIVHQFMEYIRMNDTYRNSVPTTSVLTITLTWCTARRPVPPRRPQGRRAVSPWRKPHAPARHPRCHRLPCPPSRSFPSVTLRTASQHLLHHPRARSAREDQVMFGDHWISETSPFENPVACCDQHRFLRSRGLRRTAKAIGHSGPSGNVSAPVVILIHRRGQCFDIISSNSFLFRRERAPKMRSAPMKVADIPQARRADNLVSMIDASRREGWPPL